MSLQEDVKEIVHRWKYTCTIPNEDFDEIINNILDAAVESLKNEADQMVLVFEYDRGVHDAHKREAPRIINKLRPKS